MTESHQEPQRDIQRETELPAIDLGKCIAGLVNAVTKGMAEELDPYDLNPLEFNLLRTCMERGECTATELAAELPVDASRISRIVTILVDKDLLVRRRLRSDRRIVMLRLSDKGNELTSMLLQRIQAYDAKLTHDISAEEMSVFAEAAAKIVANHEALRPSQ